MMNRETSECAFERVNREYLKVLEQLTDIHTYSCHTLYNSSTTSSQLIRYLFLYLYLPSSLDSFIDSLSGRIVLDY